MAKLPNRLVIEITNTDKVDELGNPVIGFESKDYAECVIEELEKIRSRLNHRAKEHLDGDYYVLIRDINEVFDEELAELKGETE